MNPRFANPAACPADARHFVRSTLSGAPVEAVATAELLASELVTNAIVHGAGGTTVVVDVVEGLVRVEVHDSDDTLDLAPLRVGPTCPHGRGLAIVEALASSWGVEPREDGKAVWFSIVF
jgi:anti-sigma regulatory factor (Ser/Thr protein kinase)